MSFHFIHSICLVFFGYIIACVTALKVTTYSRKCRILNTVENLENKNKKKKMLKEGIATLFTQFQGDKYNVYCIYQNYWDRHAWANSVHPDQTPRNVVSSWSTRFANHVSVFRYMNTFQNRNFQVLGQVW